MILHRQGLDGDEAAFQFSAFYALDDSIVQQRAVAVLAPPAGVTLTVRNSVLYASGDCNLEWARTMRDRAPLIAGIASVDDTQLHTLGSAVILFDVAQAGINPRQRDNLLAAAQEIEKVQRTLPQGATVELVGHADSTGAEATNELLSQQRADNVMRALVGLGVPGQSMRAIGVGMSSPLRPETDEENRQFNRSVTLRISSAAIPPKS